MLSTTELQAYFARHKLSPRAQRVIEEVRGSPPSRLVRTGIMNVACRFASRKMGRTIQSESHKNELPLLYQWEHDDATHEFYDQPPQIKLAYRAGNGRNVAHMATVDFFVLQDDFAGWVECKTEEWLLKHIAQGGTRFIRDDDGAWRLPAGEQYAAQFGLGFKVRSSKEIDWIAVRNLTFLSDYLEDSCPPADSRIAEEIARQFEAQPWVHLRELLKDRSGAENDSLYALIADGTLYVDLSRHLLSEPDTCVVFRDELAAETHGAYLQTQQGPILPRILPVKLLPDRNVSWDGKRWRIVNVGLEEVFLEDAERRVTNLKLPVVEELIRKGLMLGMVDEPAAQEASAAEILQHAGPKDQKHGLQRLALVSPSDGPSMPRNVSDRTIRRCKRLYRIGVQMFGSGLLGLITKNYKKGNRRPKLHGRVYETMDEAIKEHFLDPDAKSKTALWGTVVNRCKESGLEAPSEKTFLRRIKQLGTHRVDRARHGEKAAYSSQEFAWVADRSTPRHGERPFEIGHIDHTQLDIQLVGRRFGEKLSKPWLTILFDAYTRKVLAIILSFDSPSYRSCMGVIARCVERHGRIPKNIVVDGGKEFQCIYCETLLAYLGSHKKSRPAGKSRYGSLVERFFGIANQQFVHNLRGNNKALRNPRAMSSTHDPRDRAVWTLSELRVVLEKYIDEVYGNLEHPALGVSPNTAAMAVGTAQAGERGHTIFPYTKEFVMMCMPSTDKGTCKIQPGRGIKMANTYYWTHKFRDPAWERRDVPVRYDPMDFSRAYAYLGDHWAECRSEFQNAFAGHSVKEIELITAEITGRTKRNHERRVINASRIADFLQSTEVTEAILLQRKRDQELLLSGDQVPAVAAPAKKTLKEAPPEIEATDYWTNLTIVKLGEFV